MGSGARRGRSIARFGEPAAGGDVHLDDRLPREPLAAGIHPVAHGAALDVLHHDEHVALVLADLVHHHDVRMAEPRHRPCLAGHPRVRFLDIEPGLVALVEKVLQGSDMERWWSDTGGTREVA